MTLYSTRRASPAPQCTAGARGHVGSLGTGYATAAPPFGVAAALPPARFRGRVAAQLPFHVKQRRVASTRTASSQRGLPPAWLRRFVAVVRLIEALRLYDANRFNAALQLRLVVRGGGEASQPPPIERRTQSERQGDPFPAAAHLRIRTPQKIRTELHTPRNLRTPRLVSVL